LRLAVKTAMIMSTMRVLLLSLIFITSAEAKHTKGRSRPIATYTRGGMPNVQAQSAVVVDLDGNEELFTKNPDEIRPIASISKLFAILVVLDRKLDMDASTVMTESDKQIATGGARSRLPIGLAFTNRDLLHAALMASDNRAVPALGRAVGLDPPAMVAAMNAKAKELGLQHTTFEDPVGLNSNNRSTARDLVGLLRAAMKNTTITEITQKAKYVAHPVGKPRWTIEYTNTDVLARNGHVEVITGKTGYTDVALYCLAVAVKMANTRPVAMVFLGAVGKMTRFADFSRVSQWLTERKWKALAESKSL
jgi:D-alanyl-D-alanine endopeptidase (penicillin-binding protein 7)